MIADLDPAVLAALADLLSKGAKKSRGRLSAGAYAIDTEVTLAIKGGVRVGADEEYTPTSKMPHKLALALFLRYAGVTGPAAMEALTRAMKEALAIEALEGKAKKAAVKAIGEIADLAAAEKTVLAALEELPKSSRAGKVVVAANVNVIAAGPAVFSDAPFEASEEDEAAEDEAG